MRNERRLVIIFLLFVQAVWSSQAFAFAKATHKDLNENIANRTINKFSLNTYLKDQLGFEKGVEEILLGFSEMPDVNKNVNQMVWEWLGEGGYKEDEPESILRYPTNTARNNRHFHNPLKDWNNAGLSTIVFTTPSLVLWAQNPDQNVGGKWSWKDARDYFYEALIATDKAVKDSFFAKTFRALGQQMHLVQDVSVPAHVRNDIHILPAYEGYVDDIRKAKKDMNKQKMWQGWISDPKTFDKSILNIASTNSSAPVPVSRVIDTDLFKTGYSPDITKTSSFPQYIGLSEYTNANFLSEDSMFTELFDPNHGHYFPYPRALSTTLWPDGVNFYPYTRKYLKKTGEGDNVDHLAAVSFLYSYRLRYFQQYKMFLPVGLDDKCYEEYASNLLPRAVGYSAGLLEYFFRGKLEVTAVPVFNKNMIIYLRAKIKNLTPNETMRDGTFTLTYSYRPAGGNPDGSEDIWAQTPAVVSGTLEYGGDEQHPVEDTVIDFLLPTPIPKESYDSAKFTLAFWGTLGNEVGAVIGKRLTLGEVKFKEEWDNGLTGNNHWGHVEYNVFGWNPSNGTTTNTIVGDTLIKENNRYMGSISARVNESFVDYDYNNGEFRDKLPIPISENTYLQFKIDAMSINQIPPAPPGYSNHWQALILHFNNGLSLQYFQPGQGMYAGSNTVYLTFELGLVIVDNIYDMFKAAGITVPEPLNLEGISFLQQLFMLDEPSTVYHRQYMEIDSIRIIEGKKQ